MNEPYVREYLEDREITAWFLLDLSPSVDFGTAESERLKRTVLVDFVTTLARLLTRHGNRVGAIFYGRGVDRTIPARGGRTHVLRLVNDLLDHPRVARGGVTDLSPLLEAAEHSIKRRSLIFVISDFIGDVDWEPALTRLTQRHEVVTLRVVDPVELDLPDLGLVLVEDAETGEQLLADTSDPLFQQRLRAEVAAREEAIAAAMHRAGVTANRIGTDQDLVAALVDMVRRSKRLRRGRP
jgi:uncharacterized protein (DUF58 family)